VRNNERIATTIERRAFSVTPDDWAHVDFTRRLHRQLEELGGGKICELGGGAEPALGLDFLDQHGLDYLVVDLSEPELRKAPPGYATLVGDVSSPDFVTAERDGTYDFVFSRVLAEHVRDARQFHRNVRRLLHPGGIAMHFFPTLWWPPFVANRILPEAAAERILLRVEPWRQRSGKNPKFPAYYHWCYGPTRSQVKRLADVGFRVEHCVAYFGESTHAPGRVLEKLNHAWTQAMLRRPSYLFTSYATYTLRAQ
jgi:SAM-dependent methyltransferase